MAGRAVPRAGADGEDRLAVFIDRVEFEAFRFAGLRLTGYLTCVRWFAPAVSRVFPCLSRRGYWWIVRAILFAADGDNDEEREKLRAF